jgi:DNA-binding LytR/AlgR family response regulator
MLPENDFVRVHRSYIVSLRHIRTFTSEVIEIEDKEIPIGKLYRNTAMKVLG